MLGSHQCPQKEKGTWGLGSMPIMLVCAQTWLLHSRSIGGTQAEVQVSARQICTHPRRCILLQEPGGLFGQDGMETPGSGAGVGSGQH